MNRLLGAFLMVAALVQRGDEREALLHLGRELDRLEAQPARPRTSS